MHPTILRYELIRNRLGTCTSGPLTCIDGQVQILLARPEFKQVRGGFGVVRDRLFSYLPGYVQQPDRNRSVPNTGRQGDGSVGRAIHFTARWRGLERRWRAQPWVGVSPRASEIWDRAEAMLEVTGDRVLTDELEDLIDR